MNSGMNLEWILPSQAKNTTIVNTKAKHYKLTVILTDLTKEVSSESVYLSIITKDTSF